MRQSCFQAFSVLRWNASSVSQNHPPHITIIAHAAVRGTRNGRRPGCKPTNVVLVCSPSSPSSIDCGSSAAANGDDARWRSILARLLPPGRWTTMIPRRRSVNQSGRRQRRRRRRHDSLQLRERLGVRGECCSKQTSTTGGSMVLAADERRNRGRSRSSVRWNKKPYCFSGCFLGAAAAFRSVHERTRRRQPARRSKRPECRRRN